MCIQKKEVVMHTTEIKGSNKGLLVSINQQGNSCNRRNRNHGYKCIANS